MNDWWSGKTAISFFYKEIKLTEVKRTDHRVTTNQLQILPWKFSHNEKSEIARNVFLSNINKTVFFTRTIGKTDKWKAFSFSWFVTIVIHLVVTPPKWIGANCSYHVNQVIYVWAHKMGFLGQSLKYESEGWSCDHTLTQKFEVSECNIIYQGTDVVRKVVPVFRSIDW